MFLGDAVVYQKSLTVTATLTHVNASIPDTAPFGSSFITQLTADTDYFVNNSSVVVKMGGNDITTTAYNPTTHTISIDSLTGNVEITAAARVYEAEVTYLQSDGTAYIDTGIKASSSIKIEADIEVLSTFTGESCAIFGSRIANNNTAYALQYYKTSSGTTKYWRWAFGNGSATANHNGTTGDFHLSNTTASRSMVITGAHSSTATCSSATFSNNYNIFIFGMNSGGTLGGVGGIPHVPVKAFKMYDGSSLARDYIPVRKNGVGYLYDKVSGSLFGNANSSGAFTYGNDI